MKLAGAQKSTLHFCVPVFLWTVKKAAKAVQKGAHEFLLTYHDVVELGVEPDHIKHRSCDIVIERGAGVTTRSGPVLVAFYRQTVAMYSDRIATAFEVAGSRGI